MDGKKALCFKSFSELGQLVNRELTEVDAEFIPRSICEDPDNNYLQLIPYVVFYNKDFLEGKIRFLEYLRTNKGGEERLHNQASIGFGGHIDIFEDIEFKSYTDEESRRIYKMDLTSITQSALNAGKREVEEEIGFNVFKFFSLNPPLDSFFLFMGSNENPVNQVHVGCLIPIELNKDNFDRLLELSKENFSDREIEAIDVLAINLDTIVEEMNLTVSFIKLKEILAKEHGIEEWSCLAVENITYREIANFFAPITYNDLVELRLNKYS